VRCLRRSRTRLSGRAGGRHGRPPFAASHRRISATECALAAGIFITVLIACGFDLPVLRCASSRGLPWIALWLVIGGGLTRLRARAHHTLRCLGAGFGSRRPSARYLSQLVGHDGSPPLASLVWAASDAWWIHDPMGMPCAFVDTIDIVWFGLPVVSNVVHALLSPCRQPRSPEAVGQSVPLTHPVRSLLGVGFQLASPLSQHALQPEIPHASRMAIMAF